MPEPTEAMVEAAAAVIASEWNEDAFVVARHALEAGLAVSPGCRGAELVPASVLEERDRRIARLERGEESRRSPGQLAKDSELATDAPCSSQEVEQLRSQLEAVEQDADHEAWGLIEAIDANEADHQNELHVLRSQLTEARAALDKMIRERAVHD